MAHELTLYISPLHVQGDQVAALVGVEDLRAEYFLLLLSESAFRCVSHSSLRLEPCHEEDFDDQIEATFFTDTVIQGLDRFDSWGARHLTADTLFRDLEDGLELLKTRVQNSATTDARAAFVQTLETMRQSARLLVLQRYLNELIAHMDLASWPILHPILPFAETVGSHRRQS